jgi:alpha-mannosidase
VIRAGYEFNVPLRAVETGGHPGAATSRGSWLQVDARAVVVETVKRAEDGQGWIARLYAATGSAVKCSLSFVAPPREVGEVNLLEEPLATLTLQDCAVELAFQPFEIKTLQWQ